VSTFHRSVNASFLMTSKKGWLPEQTLREIKKGSHFD